MRKSLYVYFFILLSTVTGAMAFAIQPKPSATKPKTTAAKPKPKTNAAKPKPKVAAKPKPKPKTKPVAEKKDTVIKWYTPSEGYAKALKEKKILVVDVYTDWCYWCKVMDKETYENKEIILKMNQYFVGVKFNPENEGNHTVNGQVLSSEALMQLLTNGGRNSGYPTTYFWKTLEDNSTISAYPGYRKVDEFNGILNNWINK